jgi:hypothetical protein
MQRSSSIVKLSGYFSRSGQGLSTPMMSMQCAGQAVAQRKQATLLVLVEAMHAAINQRVPDLRLFLRIAGRDDVAGDGSGQVAEGGRQSLREQRQVHFAGPAEFRLLEPLDGRIVGFHVRLVERNSFRSAPTSTLPRC